MAQVGVTSRPVSQTSLTARLPDIQHPLARLHSNNVEKMDVRGVSRAGRTPPPNQVQQYRLPSRGPGALPGPGSRSGRPLASELGPQQRGRAIHTSGGRSSRGNRDSAPPTALSYSSYESIPEGIQVTVGDPSKPRIPIFGNRADIASRDEQGRESRVASRLSKASSQLRLEIDELEMLLREKVKNNFYELKKKFKDNDPEQKGNVSREALFRIVMTTLNRPINQSQFSRLVERLGFKDRSIINVVDFYAQFRDAPSSAEIPSWMDPVQRHWQERGGMTAAQVHTQLKEKAKQRVRDIADLIPQTNPDGSGHILKPEFRNVLNQMGFHLDDGEFDKLWAKYDTQGLGTINGEKMMQKLGISIKSGWTTGGSEPQTHNGNRSPDEHGSRLGGLRRKEVDRQRSLNMERWLKDKFRQGFRNMKEAFQACDKAKEGTVGHEDFLRVLEDFGLRLEKHHLPDFLARCGLENSKKGVPYWTFLHRFQDRSEEGMTHQVLTNPKHRYNRAESVDGKSTFSALESQLLNMFQRDFLALLGTFHKIDRLGLDYISQEEFRAAIESRFEVEVTDDQYQTLLDRVPMDDDGNVRYAEFMAQFDTKGKSKSLFGEVSQMGPKYRPIRALPEDSEPSPPLGPSPVPMDTAEEGGGSGEEEWRLREPPNVLTIKRDGGGDEDKENYMMEVQPRRSTQELFRVIKALLRGRFQEVEEAFIELDELNTNRLSHEMMFQLMKQFNMHPEITRGEIRDLWKTFITNQDKTLDYHQFTRHFGFSMRSAAFPNAKMCPPIRGDSDFLMRSRKLNCDADMLQDSLRSKIDYMWEDLRQEFVAMDPYGTGFVDSDEFREVMLELCVQLNNYELEMLRKKFDIKGDGRVSYIEFLKPFAMRRQTWRHGNNMMSLLQHPQAELPLADIVEPPQKGLTGVTARLRQKLGGDWKNLRRAFKKMDIKNSGSLSLPEFRSVLKLANVLLNEEEVYQVLSAFDEDMTGRIPYNKFLNEIVRPARYQTIPLLRQSSQF